MSTAAPLATAEALLDDLRPGDAFFSSPRHALHARGVRAVLPDGPHDRLAARVDALLADAAPGDSRAIALGALPFAPDGPVRVVVPESVRWAAPFAAGEAPTPGAGCPAAAGRDSTGPTWSVRPVPAPATYAGIVDEAVGRLDGELQKVVLARSLELHADAPLDPAALLRRLALRDPRGYAFALDVGDGETLVGASPELLVARRGDRVIARPLAGSTPRRPDPGEDHERAAALFRSAKDRHEHGVVVDAVADALRPLCATLDVPAEPALVGTATMWHLGTTVTGRLADPQPSALALATALHPTPAVCGTPPAAAHELIAELEPFERGPYAGAVGWQDAAGDGEWVVTIRCGLVRDNALRLFAGAGVVAGSRGEDELAETAAKFRTFLSAIGVEEER
ncbi:isochorismate synthase [Patulibacter sp. SYSU D01012]|uniref:isochorismate synthase n=1 Tax=Patulibacter sp. SYSU D01012 TaxID=2817381 RepID=UPI001B309C59|nr:isochorismate synthase [Patulibacter sp. SYSU D01012]